MLEAEEKLLDNFKRQFLDELSRAKIEHVRIIQMQEVSLTHSERPCYLVDGEIILPNYDKFVFSAVYSPYEPSSKEKH